MTEPTKCEACGQSAEPIVATVQMGNGIVLRVCRGCVESWLQEWPGWIPPQARQTLEEATKEARQ